MRVKPKRRPIGAPAVTTAAATEAIPRQPAGIVAGSQGATHVWADTAKSGVAVATLTSPTSAEQRSPSQRMPRSWRSTNSTECDRDRRRRPPYCEARPLREGAARRRELRQTASPWKVTKERAVRKLRSPRPRARIVSRLWIGRDTVAPLPLAGYQPEAARTDFILPARCCSHPGRDGAK
mgnify:CR=1 FL=1